MQPKIYSAEEMPEPIYRAKPYLNFSVLKLMCKGHSPRKVWWESWMNHEREVDGDDTKAKRDGRILHLYMQNPKQFRHIYRLDPDHKTSTKPFTIGAAKGGDYDRLLKIYDNLMELPLSNQILINSRPEVTMEADLQIEDLQAPAGKLLSFPCKCRVDIMKPTFLADFKFVESVTDEAISSFFATYLGHQQAEWYLRIYNTLVEAGVIVDITTDGRIKKVTQLHNNFAFIFCEKNPPWDVRIVQVMDGPLKFAKDRNDMALSVWMDYWRKYSHISGKWPGYGNVISQLVMEGEGGPNSISLPSWLK